MLMFEAIEFLVRESRKASKRENRHALAVLGLMLTLLDRLQRKGYDDAKAARLVAEWLDQARFERPHWVGGVRVPSIIRTYQGGFVG